MVEAGPTTATATGFGSALIENILRSATATDPGAVMDEQEERKCRICLDGEDPSLGRLIKPCKCNGKLIFLVLLLWLSVSRFYTIRSHHLSKPLAKCLDVPFSILSGMCVPPSIGR